MSSSSPIPISNKQIFALYWRQLKKHTWLWIGLLFVIFAAQIFAVLIPLADKQLIDAAAASLLSVDRPIDLMWKAFVLIIAARLGGWVFWRLSGWIATWVISRAQLDLEVTGFEGVLRHSYDFFASNFAGSLIRRIQRLSTSFGNMTDVVVWELFPSAVVVVGTLFILLRYYPVFGILMFIWFVIVIAESIIFLRWKLPYDQIRAQRDSEQTGALSDAVTNALNILQFNGQVQEKNTFRKVTQQTFLAWVRSWRLSEINMSIQYFVNIGLEGGLIGLAIWQWKLGNLTIGDFALLQGFTNTLTNNLRDTGRSLRTIFESLADAKEMVEILERPVDIKDAVNAKDLAIKQGAIQFDNVEFSYKSQPAGVKGLNLSIEGGEKVALVGPSGAGKSTITKLLFRFYEITKGSIKIDGQDLKKITQESLRHNISLVPQEPILFHRTILENIRYGKPEATDEEVMEAAKKARCHEFISRLAEGYNTFVGERGIKLSGGERQRVAIARAILKNAPILVLDEATSSLDSESEALIQEALHTLMEGKTTIVIAHRLSTVMQMDRILVLSGGKIVDQGTHADLTERDGLYQSLWNIQAGGFTTQEAPTEQPVTA